MLFYMSRESWWWSSRRSVGADALGEGDEFLGLPFFGLPLMGHVLETEFGGGAQVRFVVTVALNIHLAGIPVAGLRLALRSSMGQDAELAVAEPFGDLVLGERFPGGLELAWSDWLGGGGYDRRKF